MTEPRRYPMELNALVGLMGCLVRQRAKPLPWMKAFKAQTIDDVVKVFGRSGA